LVRAPQILKRLLGYSGPELNLNSLKKNLKNRKNLAILTNLKTAFKIFKIFERLGTPPAGFSTILISPARYGFRQFPESAKTAKTPESSEILENLADIRNIGNVARAGLFWVF
jgi:hypothetical protein